MVATSRTAYKTLRGREEKTFHKKYNRVQINSIVSSGTAAQKAELSEYFFLTNGLYKRIILHYATFLTYSWVLVPHIINKKSQITETKIANAYRNASDFATNFQIERKSALFAKDVLVKGGYYGLIIDDGTDIVIQDLPFKYCRSRFKNHQDIDLIEFSMKFFDDIREDSIREQILRNYPKIFQKAYKSYTKDKANKEWFLIPAEMGIYFNFFEETPFFLDLIPLLADLDDYKEMDKKRNLLALRKILVQKIGRDGLKLVFEPEEAEEMHEGAINMLPNNPDIDVITTYNDISLLDLSSDDDEKTEIQDVQNLIYESAGVSKELFSSTTSAGNEYSINNDLSMMMILGYKFARFYSVLLNYKFANNKVKFKLIILPVSAHNSKDYTSRAKELAAFGYVFSTPIVSTGLDQVDLEDMKILENDLLNLDEILKPLQSAYTQSGKVGQTVATSEISKTQTTTTSNSSDNQENTKTQTNSDGDGMNG